MASPTVAKDSVFITASVDAHKDRDVAAFDTLVEYIHTEAYKELNMFLEVSLAELMVKVVPKMYQKYVIMIIKGK